MASVTTNGSTGSLVSSNYLSKFTKDTNVPRRSSSPSTKAPITFVHNTRVPFSKTPSELGHDSIESSSEEEEGEIPHDAVERSDASHNKSKGGKGDDSSLSGSESDDSDSDKSGPVEGSESSTALATQLPSATLDDRNDDVLDENTNNKKKKLPKKMTKKQKKDARSSQAQKRKMPQKRAKGEQRLTISERAGLQLPVGRVNSFVKMYLGEDVKTSIEAKIMLTAETQHLLRKLTLTALEKKNEVDPDRKTLTREDMNNAIRDSPLFSLLGEGLMIPTSDSGVVNLPLTKKMKREVSLFKKSKKKKRPATTATASKKTAGTKRARNKRPTTTNKKSVPKRGSKKQVDESLSSSSEGDLSSRSADGDEENEGSFSSSSSGDVDNENVKKATKGNPKRVPKRQNASTKKPVAQKKRKRAGADEEEQSRPKKKANNQRGRKSSNKK